MADKAYTFELPVGEFVPDTNIAIISGGRIYPASNNIPNHATKVFVYVVSAGPNRARVSVGGIVQYSGSLNLEYPIFLDINGQVTQTANTTGFIKVLGKAVDTTRYLFQPETSIILI